MQLYQLLAQNRVIYHDGECSKKRALEIISQSCAENLTTITTQPISTQQILNSLIQREKLGSTGLGNGIAVPHAQLQDIQTAIGAVLYLKHPIEFTALDNSPVYLLVALLLPQQLSNTDKYYLEILAKLAKVFNQPSIHNKLQQVTDAKQLYHILIGAS